MIEFLHDAVLVMACIALLPLLGFIAFGAWSLLAWMVREYFRG